MQHQQPPWRVNLLGVPSASRGGEDARLRSKETWAVLASLLLPEPLNGGHRYSSPPPPPLCSRETLAVRFWGDSRNSPRACLRQSLASLRTAFGADCFLSEGGERQDVRAGPGCFETDVGRMLASYHAALLAPSPEERLFHLTEAEGEIRGELLEGCVEPGDPGELWLLGRRADVRTKVVLVLTALLDALTEQGSQNAALDVARRALRFHPGDDGLRKRAWELAVATGQEDALREIEGAEGLGDAVARLRHRDADSLTPREGRLFASLFRAQVSRLPENLREHFLPLAVLPAPFTARQARDICRVPKAALEALERTPLVDREDSSASDASGGRYFLPKVVRDAALRELPAPARRQLEGRIAAYCHDYVLGVRAARPQVPPPPFDTPERAEPFFRAALEWHFAQLQKHQQQKRRQNPPPTRHTEGLIEMVGCLPFLGLSGLAREAVPDLRRAFANESIALPLRHHMFCVAGNTLFLCHDHAGVIEFFTRAIAMENAFADSFPPGERMTRHAALAIAHHYAGNSRAALIYLRQAQAHHERTGRTALVAESLRIQAEILNHLGECEEALRACERALALRRAIYEGSAAAVIARHEVADALFWKGSTLFRLGRFGEATDGIREALALWQETENATGIGHCLRLLGRLRAEEGVFGEAKAHLHHAILIHEKAGSAGCRMAAVEALADVLLREGKPAQARPLYGECLAHHAAQEPPRPSQVERFTRRIAECDEAAALWLS